MSGALQCPFKNHGGTSGIVSKRAVSENASPRWKPARTRETKRNAILFPGRTLCGKF